MPAPTVSVLRDRRPSYACDCPRRQGQGDIGSGPGGPPDPGAREDTGDWVTVLPLGPAGLGEFTQDPALSAPGQPGASTLRINSGNWPQYQAAGIKGRF